MKTKRTSLYIVSIVLLVIMILGSLGVTTWALLSTKLQVGGNIGFTGTGDVLATVANGKVEGGTLADQANKLNNLKIEAEGVTAGSVESWKELQLAFDSAGNDVSLSFSIKNDQAESSDKYLRVDLNADFGAQDYITATVTAAGKTSANSVKIAPQARVTYNIVFAVKSGTNSVTSLSFDLLFNMVNITYTPEILRYNLLEDGTYEVFAGADCEGDISIPAWYNDKLVSRIADNGFKDCTALTSVFIEVSCSEFLPDYTMARCVVGNSAFAGCTKMTSFSIGYALPDSTSTLIVGENAFEVNVTTLIARSEFGTPEYHPIESMTNGTTTYRIQTNCNLSNLSLLNNNSWDITWDWDSVIPYR